MTEDENKTKREGEKKDLSGGGDPGDSLYVLAEGEGDENQLRDL